MATNRTTAQQKAAEAEKPADAETPTPDVATEDAPGTVQGTDPAAEVQQAEVQDADDAVLHTDITVNKVAPQDGQEHGYIGQAHPEKNRDDYTVAGVTGATAKANDKPSQDGENIRKAWAPLQAL